MSDYAIGEGDAVPAASVPAWPEGEVNLADMKGQWMVIYFYPKDSTPGCTTESCDFRDAHAELRDMGVRVFGVSRDSLRSHQRFAEKHQLPFPLLSDADERLCEAFDVIRMKNMYGRQVRGIERSTFIVDPQGIIRRVWRKVKVKGHVDDVRQALSELMNA